MDSRQRRVNRIAQAIIEQGLINSDNDDSTEDEDFSSQNTQESTKSDSSMTESEEEREVDQKELEKQQRQKKKQDKEELDSLKDALRSRISSNYKVKDQFKLTDDEFTKHLAVTTVWNEMTREKAARQLLAENIQFERNQEKQRQEKTLDQKPFTAFIVSDSAARSFKALLELHFGPAAKNLFFHLKQGTSPADWAATLDSKQLPDDCDYEKLLIAFQKSVNGYQTNKKVVKASFHDGKLHRFESLELTGDSNQQQMPSFAQLQEAEAQLANKPARAAQYNTKLKTVTQINTNLPAMMLVNGKAEPLSSSRSRKRNTQGTISFDAAVKHQQELYNRTKMMAQEIQNQVAQNQAQGFQTKSNIQSFQPQIIEQKTQFIPKPVNTDVQTIHTVSVMKPSGMYNVPKKPGSVVDQSSYPVNPDAKDVQTTVSLIEKDDFGPTSTYKIVASVPKRNQFNKFYNVVDGKPCNRTMNVLMQTDLLAKQLRGSSVIEKGTGGEGSNAFIIFDGVQHELSKTSKALQTKLLKGCADLQINRWKGRQGTMINDFLELVKKIRPDLYARGDQLFINNRNQFGKATSNNEKNSKREVEREGVWPTLDGLQFGRKTETNANKPINQTKAHSQHKIKTEDEDSFKEDQQAPVDTKLVAGNFVEVVHTHVDDFYTTHQVIQYQNDNGHQCPSFLDKFYMTFDSIDEQREYARKLIKKQYIEQFKYTHPVTGEGYNTIEEYKAIQQKLRENDQKRIKPVVDKIQELQVQFQDLINKEEFAAAQDVYVQMNKLIVPTYIQYRDQDLPESRLNRIKLPIISAKNYNQETPTDVDYLNNDAVLDRDFKVNKAIGFAGTVQNVGWQICYSHPFKQLD